jgi:hypothetical protein
MKKFMIRFAFIAIAMMSFISVSNATTTCHCYGEFYIDDPGFFSGDYYDIYLRIETSTSWTSNWVHFTTVYSVGSSVPFTNVVIGSVPFPTPLPADFYTIRIMAMKNGTTPENNSSLADPEPILPIGNTKLTAYTDPIEVKFP